MSDQRWVAQLVAPWTADVAEHARAHLSGRVTQALGGDAKLAHVRVADVRPSRLLRDRMHLDIQFDSSVRHLDLTATVRPGHAHVQGRSSGSDHQAVTQAMRGFVDTMDETDVSCMRALWSCAQAQVLRELLSVGTQANDPRYRAPACALLVLGMAGDGGLLAATIAELERDWAGTARELYDTARRLVRS